MLFHFEERQRACEKLFEDFFFRRTPEFSGKFTNFWSDDVSFFEDHFRVVSLVLDLGIEHSCPWPREGLSSERLSLASDFFCVFGLGLEHCVPDSTSVVENQKKKVFT